MWLSDARVVAPDRTIARGSVRIEGAWIVEVVDGPAPLSADDPVVDAHNLTLLPGIVDVHGDMLERDMEPRPGVMFPVDLALLELDKRLASTGVTTAFAAVSFLEGGTGISIRNTDRACDIVMLVNEMADSLLVDMRVHTRFEITNPAAVPVLLDLIDRGMVNLVSLMDHTPGQGQYRNLDTYTEVIEKWRKVSRDEADRMAAARIKHASERQADWDAAQEVSAAALSHGLTVASHDDDSREKVDQVVRSGVTMCEFPVTIEAAQRARERGLCVVMGAPNLLLGGSHNGNLSAREAIEAGLVDVLCADYYPAALLHSVYALHRAGILPLHTAARLVSLNAAAAVGLDDRGSISPGHRADIVVVEESARPRVRGSLSAGTPIYWDAMMASRAPSARLIPNCQTSLGERQ